MTYREFARRYWPVFVPVVISAVLSSWALGNVGWGNNYYAAAVRSMSESWHAFWYGALDSAGFVTVDKPPMSMWVQALVVRVFGFHSMSLLVPQVLAGVGSVVLVYATLVRRWGRIAATTGALALAVTPISVMVNHSNNTDAILTFLMTATVCAGVRATDTGRVRWVAITGLLFGASFTTKMLAAAPVLPAVLIAFALASTLATRQRIKLLAVGTLVSVVSALAWFAWVDLTPVSSRPYVGSSFDNSAFQLAFERNGVNQVEGGQVMSGGPDSGGRGMGMPGMGAPEMGEPPAGSPLNQMRDMQLPANAPELAGQLRQVVHGFEGGDPGIFRLFNSELGSQIGWLIVPAAAGLIGAVFSRRRRVLKDPVVLSATIWFVGGAAAYSITQGIVHPYYVASIAPPLAMLIGVGFGVLREHWTSRFTTSVAGAVVAASGIASWTIARRSDWTLATVVSSATVMVGVMIAVTSAIIGRRARWAVAAPLLVLAAPFVWTAGSLKSGLSSNLPYAEPAQVLEFGRPNNGGRQPGFQDADASLIAYLQVNRGNSKWLVATQSAMTAAPIIIETGEAVMALGGFSGGDDILSTDDFDSLVANGDVRYVYIGMGGRGGPGGGNTPQGGPGGNGLTSHITSTCSAMADFDGLYDCAS